MKAISLWQPWATLCVIGAKTFETRSWDTPYRGRILIHASKRNTGEEREYFMVPAFKKALNGADYWSFYDLPFGAIVGAVTLATIGSVIRNVAQFDHIRYVIVDECHLINAAAGMYSDFFKALPGVRILGMTATPYRLVSTLEGPILKFLTRTKPRVFSEVVYHVQNGQLFRDGHLAKLEYHQIKAIDRSKLEANSTGADYTDASVQKQFRAEGFSGKLERVVNRLIAIDRKAILVFTRFVEESRNLVDRIPGAAMVSAETPDGERARILKEFQAGKIRVVANVGVLTTGFDYPELDSVVLARPTMSLALYYQMVGRCVRPHPNKPHAMVVDMVGLQDQFGKVEDLRLECDQRKLWYISSGGKQLTNVIFGTGRF